MSCLITSLEEPHPLYNRKLRLEGFGGTEACTLTQLYDLTQKDNCSYLCHGLGSQISTTQRRNSGHNLE